MYRSVAILLIAGFQLAACGLKGPLTLPPGPTPEPLFGHARPATQPAPKPVAADVSTPRKDPAP